MDVQVTTTEVNQRVKLDATMLTTLFSSAATSFRYLISFNLFRNPATLLANTETSGNYSKPSEANSYRWTCSFIFVDTPGPIGSYTYRITVTDLGRTDVTAVFVSNLGFTATVYPPI
ncbi:hypothetical protein AB2553_06630 [Bacillus mycoides]|uniref:hypothetical protein n=1 Tax=Bacillus mycoides TaxID=1405 RepID=UPI00346461F3